jgi:CRP-like cAMP-binding protein
VEVVFKEGIFPSGIFYIIEGKVKKYKVDKEGKEHFIYIANTGELIGYHTVLAQENYPDSAATLEESTLVFIPKDDLLLTLNQSSELNQRLLKTLSHEFNVLANSLTVFAKKTVRQRLALQLIIIREKYKIPLEPGKPVEINISRDDFANMVGTARGNVVRY